MRAIATIASHAAALLSAALWIGCGAGGNGDTPAATPPAFGAIYDALFPAETNARCNFCHAMPASDTSNGNLHMGLTKAEAYDALVGKTSKSAKCMGRPLVTANQPEMSLLLQKFSATPPCGDRMPLGGKPLPAEQVEMIRSWIAAGAKSD